MKHSEADIASVVVAWLEALGGDVYQEVEIPGGVADIVTLIRAEAWIVEVKTSLSLALLMQARARRELASRVYVAAPHSRTLRDFSGVADELGIGVLVVSPSLYGDDPRVEERVSSRRWNRRPERLRGLLRPGHKTHAKAGAASAAGRWTPFRDTCDQLARLVKANPGVTLKSAIAQIKHHYRTPSSARSSIAHWVARGKVPGVEIVKSDDGAVLVPTEAS